MKKPEPRYYGFIFFFVGSLVLSAGFLVGMIFDYKEYRELGLVVKGRVDRKESAGISRFHYTISYDLDGEKSIYDVRTINLNAQVGDSVLLNYSRKNGEILLVAEVDDLKGMGILSAWILVLVAGLIMVLQFPEIMDKFDGSSW